MTLLSNPNYPWRVAYGYSETPKPFKTFADAMTYLHLAYAEKKRNVPIPNHRFHVWKATQNEIDNPCHCFRCHKYHLDILKHGAKMAS